MVTARFSLTDEQLLLLSRHRELGFVDKSSLLRAALDQFRQQWRRDQVTRSAELYAELYEQDEELQQLTEQANQDWP